LDPGVNGGNYSIKHNYTFNSILWPKGTNSMANEFRNELIWLPCTGDNALAEAFGVPGFRGYLPFLAVNGEVLPSPDERQLLLGVIKGWPRLVSGNALGVPNEREQRDILLILFDRLLLGFGWESPMEAATHLGHYLVSIEEGETVTAFLDLLLQQTLEPKVYFLRCAYTWDNWLKLKSESAFLKAYEAFSNVEPTGFPKSMEDWLWAIQYGFFETYKIPSYVDRSLYEPARIREIGDARLREKLVQILSCKADKRERLSEFGFSNDSIEGTIDILNTSPIELPIFNPDKVTQIGKDQRNMLTYTYHPGGETVHEAFNLKTNDLKRFLEDLVNMALDFQHNNPGGKFLRVDAANRLLSNRSDGGNILMFFAWQRIEELVGDSINKAVSGTEIRS
jgi:hypothetical protein